MNARLFVYGTLLSRVSHPMGARLRREARLLGAAAMPGRLYSLGRYPGMVDPADPEHLVHGELYALRMPGVTLKWLDAYEGIVPGKPGLSPYTRVERPARLASGEALDAWVYLYRRSVKMRPELPDGRWMAPAV